MDKSQIREAYKTYLLENGKVPVSVYSFCQILQIPESEFYDNYSTLEAIEKDIWLSIFDDTITQLNTDEIYNQYSTREKLLSFYFLWVQKLKENRSFILLQKDILRLPTLREGKLGTFRKAYYDYVRGLIKDGYTTGEIKERKYISDQYVHGFWVQALFVLRYWIKDDSLQFEQTDAAIEKAVNLSFELVNTNALDSLLDFGKFILAKK